MARYSLNFLAVLWVVAFCGFVLLSGCTAGFAPYESQSQHWRDRVASKGLADENPWYYCAHRNGGNLRACP